MSSTDSSEGSTHVILKAYYDEDFVFTVDFTDNEDRGYLYTTKWTCIPSSGKCAIKYSREVHGYLCDVVHHFDNPPVVKVASFRNPEQKVILVLRHDTKESALGMMCKLTDVKNTLVKFLRRLEILVDNVKASVELQTVNEPADQQNGGGACLFESTPDCTKTFTSETIWLCRPDAGFKVDDGETSRRHFTKLRDNIRRIHRACLRYIRSGSIKFYVHHETPQDALEMISHYEEVRAMILECLQGIDPTVKNIQMEVKLQDFIDPRSLPEHSDIDKGYVDKQEHDKVVQDLSGQVATLKQELQEMKEMERAQLADILMSMWRTRSGSPQPSESSGFFTSADTITDVGDAEVQDATDLSELGGSHRQKGRDSQPQYTSRTVSDLRRQFEDTRQELKATRERMHRLEEIAQREGPVAGKKADSQARSETDALRPGPTQKSGVAATIRKLFTRKSGTPSRPDTRATPTPALRDARAYADLLVACGTGNLAEVKRILDTGRVDVNCRGGDGGTLVMWAAMWGRRDVVKLLVSRGADLSLVTYGGDNILHWACRAGDRKMVEFVLSLDAVDVNARNNNGKTAADVARRRGHHQLSDLLVSRGTQ